MWWKLLVKEDLCQQKEQKIEAEVQVQELQPHLCSGELSDLLAVRASLLCNLSTDSMVVRIPAREDSSTALNETACIQGEIFMT